MHSLGFGAIIEQGLLFFDWKILASQLGQIPWMLALFGDPATARKDSRLFPVSVDDSPRPEPLMLTDCLVCERENQLADELLI
jgi:hypothetical protein